MKICCRCKKNKAVEEFNFKYKKKKIRQKACKECTRKEIRNHYQKNRDYYLKKALARNNEKREEIRAYIWAYLEKHPCVDCGESDPIVLDFDHKKDKIAAVSTIQKDHNLKKIEQEINKCTVRCANCHRRKTAKEFNWYKSKQAPVAQLDRAPVFGTGG